MNNKSFTEHLEEEAKKKKLKNPWLGALLALIFGPLGLLYYSWKSALGGFIVVSIVILFLIRAFDYDLTWYFYNIPIAFYAYFDIKFWNAGVTYYKHENHPKI